MCGTKLGSSRWTKMAIDHCHKTGQVRGLLCTNCNTAIGLMKDSPERLEAAASYIRNSRYDIVSTSGQPEAAHEERHGCCEPM